MSTIGERIKSARKAANLTIEQMLPSMELSRSAYISLESDKTDIKVRQLIKISEITEENFTYLATGKGHNNHQLEILNTLIDNTMCGLSQIHSELNPKSA